MSSGRTSPGSSLKGQKPADIVVKMSVAISNFVHIAAGGYKCGLRACILGVRCQCSGVSKQMTEDRKQKSGRMLHPPVFTICLLSSDI